MSATERSETGSSTPQSDLDHYDAFIAYRRGDGATLARWLRSRLQNFVLPDEIVRDIPPAKQAIHIRRPRVFLDTAYEKSSDDWLSRKVFPALDSSDRLVVISTPLAFTAIQQDGAEKRNWLIREIDRFLTQNEETIARPVDVVIGPGADTERFPGRLSVFKTIDWIDLRRFSWWRSYGLSHRLDSGIAKLIASFYDVPDRHLPLLYNEEVRQRRQAFRTNVQISFVTLTAVSALALSIYDYVGHQRALDQAYDNAKNFIDNQEFEKAMRVVIARLPPDYDFPWRPGWKDQKVRKLLAKLAGAAQFSAYLELIRDEQAPIQSVSFDNTGSKLVAASQAGTVSVWDSEAPTKKLTCIQDNVFKDIRLPPRPGSTVWVRDSQFGRSGSNILSVGRYGGWIWNSDCPECKEQRDNEHCSPLVRMVGHTGDVRTGVFSPDLRFVVTTSDDGTLRVWDASTGKQDGIIELPPSALPPDYQYTTSADISPNGRLIAVSRRDGLIAIADFASRVRSLPPLQTTGAAVWSVRFDHQGQRVVSASANGEVAIWSLASRSKLTLPRHPNAVSSASFSPDDKLIVTTSGDQTVRLWDSVKLTEMLTLKGHEGPVLSSSFSPDGKRLVTSSDDKTARVWSLGPDIIPSSLQVSDYSILSAALNAGGQDFVTGGFDGKVSLYKIGKQHGIARERELTPNIGAITGVGFSTDLGKIIASSNSGSVFLWDRTGDVPVQLAQLPKGDTLVAIDFAGNLAAISESLSSVGDNSRIWDLQTKRSRPLEGATSIKSIEFDERGTRVVAGSEAATETGERLAKIWDARTGRMLSTFEHSGPVLSAHFSQDGRWIATSSLDYKAYVWDAKSGEHKKDGFTQVFVGHSYDVNSARFSPDAERVVTASSDRTVRVWDVRTGTEILRFLIGTEAMDAFFTRDGRRILVTTAEGEVRDYDVSWSIVLDSDLKSRVCKDKLNGIDKEKLCSH